MLNGIEAITGQRRSEANTGTLCGSYDGSVVVATTENLLVRFSQQDSLE